LSENGHEPTGDGAAPKPESETTPEEETASSLELDRSVLKPKPAPAAESPATKPAGEETVAKEAAVTAAAPAAAVPVEKAPVPWALYSRLAGFVSMLVLAILGMYFIRSGQQYVWV
jgi:hypothetical protein